MLDRISKVLHQAENASTPEEAAAFMQKAQELASANAIDLAIARAHQADKSKRQTPEKRTIRIEERSWRLSPTTKWKCQLFLAIAAVNDLECLIASNNTVVWPFGFPGDQDVAEALYNSLVIQMVAAADDGLKRGLNKEKKRVYKRVREEIPNDERAWGEPVDEESWNTHRYYADSQSVHDEMVEQLGQEYADKHYPLPPKFRKVRVKDENGEWVIEESMRTAVDGRIWRQNFYDGFIARISGRLWAAKAEARKQYDDQHASSSDETGLVLRSKALEVSEAFKADVGDRKLGVHKEPEIQWDWRGREAGQQAGAVASLGTEVTLGASNKKALG
jgi:hypothetical protein